jgi:phosphohistidine phosphatase SixA
VSTLAVIGHNPTIHELAAALSADDERSSGLANGFPTAAVAVIAFAAAQWGDIGVGGGRLVEFVTPGQFKSAAP